MDEDLKKIAPILSNIKKDHLFKVPDNYFDDFTEKLFDRINKEKRNRNVILFLNYRNILKIAASLILVFTLYLVANHIINKNKNFNLYSKYVFDNINDFDESLVFEMNFENNYNNFIHEDLIYELDYEDILNFID